MIINAYAIMAQDGMPCFSMLFRNKKFDSLMEGITSCAAYLPPGMPQNLMLCFADSDRHIVVINGHVQYDSF